MWYTRKRRFLKSNFFLFVMLGWFALTALFFSSVTNKPQSLPTQASTSNSCNAYILNSPDIHPKGPQPYVKDTPGFLFFKSVQDKLGYKWQIYGDKSCTDGTNSPSGGQKECASALGVPQADAWCFGFGAENEETRCMKNLGPDTSCDGTQTNPSTTSTPISTTPRPSSPPSACQEGPNFDIATHYWKTDCSKTCSKNGSTGSMGQGNAFSAVTASTETAGNCNKSIEPDAVDVLCYTFSSGNYCAYKFKKTGVGTSSNGTGGYTIPTPPDVGGTATNSQNGDALNADSITSSFVANITSVCGSNVNSNSRDCIPKIKVPVRQELGSIVHHDFTESIDGAGGVVQCVYFAKNLFMLIHGCMPYTSSNSCTHDNSVKNAKDYADTANFSYVNADFIPPSTKPILGDFPIFASNHVGIVGHISTTGKSFLLGEGNRDGNGKVTYDRVIMMNDPDIMGYLRFKKI